MRVIIKKIKDVLNEKRKEHEAQKIIKQCRNMIKQLNKEKDEKKIRKSSLELSCP